MELVIERLRNTSVGVLAELADFNEAQWQWRPEDGRWTTQENLEHLIMVERGVMILVQRAVAVPPTERAVPLTDEDVWRRLTAPGRGRATAPERVQPKGMWTDRAAALAEFSRLREATIAYASTTTDPLRERFLTLPVGEVDGVQALLMLAGHAQRHLEQIRQLRAVPGFPAAT